MSHDYGDTEGQMKTGEGKEEARRREAEKELEVNSS